MDDMDREILFRGKRVDNGEWVEGCRLIDYITGQRFIHASGNGLNESDKVGEDGCLKFFAYEVDSKTVCQYTGLTDKNGKKIFEGDIVKYHFGEEVAPIKFGTYQSCFDSQHAEHCGFYVDWKEKRNFRKDLGYWIHMVNAEIVGNIHDNGSRHGEVE